MIKNILYTLALLPCASAFSGERDLAATINWGLSSTASRTSIRPNTPNPNRLVLDSDSFFASIESSGSAIGSRSAHSGSQVVFGSGSVSRSGSFFESGSASRIIQGIRSDLYVEAAVQATLFFLCIAPYIDVAFTAFALLSLYGFDKYIVTPCTKPPIIQAPIAPALAPPPLAVPLSQANLSAINNAFNVKSQSTIVSPTVPTLSNSTVTASASPRITAFATPTKAEVKNTYIPQAPPPTPVKREQTLTPSQAAPEGTHPAPVTEPSTEFTKGYPLGKIAFATTALGIGAGYLLKRYWWDARRSSVPEKTDKETETNKPIPVPANASEKNADGTDKETATATQ